MPLPSKSPSSFLNARAENLRRNGWGRAFGSAWLTLMACAGLKVLLPTALRDMLRPLLAIAPLLPLMAKDLAHLPDALARSRSARAPGQWLLAWLPPECVGLLRLDGLLRCGCMHWLRRRSPPPAPAGLALSYLERGSYRTVVAIALLALLAEMPVHAGVGSLFLHDAATRHLVQALTLVASLSSLAWVTGDRWWMGQGRHVLDARDLHVRVGARTIGTIARAAIAGCERLSVPAAEWCARHGIDPRAALCASPFDQPNAVLMLTPGADVRLQHLGRERAGLACVFLYLDRPDALMAALREAPPAA